MDEECYINKLFIPGVDAQGEVYCLVDMEYNNKYKSYFIYPRGVFDTKFSLKRDSNGIKELAMVILSDIMFRDEDDIKYNSEFLIRFIINDFIDRYLTTGGSILEAEILMWIPIIGGK